MNQNVLPFNNMELAHSKRGLVLNPHTQKIELGETSIERMHERNIPHLHAAILITRENVRSGLTEILLGQRSFGKKQFPGFWCFAAAGHCTETDYNKLDSSNSSEVGPDLVGMQREIAEELGLEIKLDEHSFDYCKATVIRNSRNQSTILRGKNLWRYEKGNLIQKNEYNSYTEQPIFTVGQLEVIYGDITVNKSESSHGTSPDEVITLQWFTLDQLTKLRLTPWLKHFLPRIS